MSKRQADRCQINFALTQVPDVANAYFTNRYPGYRLVSYQCNEQTKSLSVLVLEPLLDGVVCPRCGAYCNERTENCLLG